MLLKYYLGWCYYQELWQVLLPGLWADVTALVCELLVPHCKSIDYIAKQGGRCYCQHFVWWMVKLHDQM